MLLGVLDNRDSFTYNLVHLLEPFFEEVRVRRCDNPSALGDLHDADALVLSPGPGLPRESGVLMDVIADHFGRTPILGVCLGMQALFAHSEEGDCTGLGLLPGNVRLFPADAMKEADGSKLKVPRSLQQ
jgi:anthranilate/para-aminobenzoate synthase component II